MPHRPPKPCCFPGCPELTHSRFCRSHARQEQRDYDKRRGSSWDRGYRAAWRIKRAAFLKAHPVCEDCPEPSTDADHVPSRRVLVAQGVQDPDAAIYLRARCHSCHSRKTATEDARWGRSASTRSTASIWMPEDDDLGGVA